MLPWESKIPDYLTDKKNVVSFILFTAAFALVFINIYAPFGVDKWLNVSEVEFFLYSSIVILIGMLVIVISRVLMYMFTRRDSINYAAYALWIMAEIVVLALVYTLIQWYFLHVGNDFLMILKNSVRTTAYIILLPYVISWLYLSFKDKYTTLEKMENNRRLDEINETTGKKVASQLVMIPFHDEKGVLKFSIKKDDLLYIEAADNYIVIYYLEHMKLSKYMIRNTLKRIELSLPEAGLVRCHRSYMVNIDNVKFIRKEKEGLIIGFDSPSDVVVPISKTYLDIFVKRLSHYTGLGEN
ncbi:MAG: LytTR family transcriptional regulator [Bacteroidales bacterium]|nr:LytTR family transcriptional regulator [Bacteroidales bacterium]